MKERRVLVKAFAGGYRRASKKEKGEILDRFVVATGYQRRYAARLLRGQGRRMRLSPRVVVEGDIRSRVGGRRKSIYDEAVKGALKGLWQMLDYLCGKRLVAALPGTLEALERHGELKLAPSIREKLLSISAATIDRLLFEEKQRLRWKGRSGTKPGTLLRHQVAVRTYQDWDEGQPGFVEMDLVAHEGGNGSGDYVQTLDLTDVCTGWTEPRQHRDAEMVLDRIEHQAESAQSR